MHKRYIELLGTQEDLSQAFSDCGDGVCGNAAALGGVGYLCRGIAKGQAFNPFHKDDRCVAGITVAIGFGKAAQQ